MLGAAWIARVALLPAIASSGNGRLVALASRSPQRAHALVAGHAEARVVDDYDAVLSDPDVDAVYIPLVNHLHLPWALRAFDAGKHVLCEKPLAMNAEEAERMAVAADRAGRLLMEAFMYRFNPRVREFVAAASEALHVDTAFGFTLADAANYRFDAAMGGGALLDVGSYGVSAARWILGEPTDVTARCRIRGGVDVSTSALLAFERGRTASVFASFESAEHQQLTAITPAAVHRLERPFTPLDDPLAPYRLMVESFADSMLEGRPVAIPPSESVANMRVLDRIRAAASP